MSTERGRKEKKAFYGWVRVGRPMDGGRTWLKESKGRRRGDKTLVPASRLQCTARTVMI